MRLASGDSATFRTSYSDVSSGGRCPTSSVAQITPPNAAAPLFIPAVLQPCEGRGACLGRAPRGTSRVGGSGVPDYPSRRRISGKDGVGRLRIDEPFVHPVERPVPRGRLGGRCRVRGAPLLGRVRGRAGARPPHARGVPDDRHVEVGARPITPRAERRATCPSDHSRAFAPDAVERASVLTSLSGVGEPIASAILAVGIRAATRSSTGARPRPCKPRGCSVRAKDTSPWGCTSRCVVSSPTGSTCPTQASRPCGSSTARSGRTAHKELPGSIGTVARPDPAELHAVIELTAREAAAYLKGIADRPVRDPRADEVAAGFGGPLPEQGIGAVGAIEELLGGIDGAVHSAGPEVLPLRRRRDDPRRAGRGLAHLGARPEPGAWVSSPLAGRLEQLAIEWLKELFGLPARGAACSRPAPRWRTSWPSHARDGGAPNAPASTSTSSAWPRHPRSRCSAAGTPIRATSRRSGCWGSAAPACGSSRATPWDASTSPRWRPRSPRWTAHPRS